MAEWDKFVIYEPEKVIINNKTKLDIIEIPSGKYFLDKETLANKTNPEYPIYTMVGHTADGKSGITIRITDKKRLDKIIQEIEENISKL